MVTNIAKVSQCTEIVFELTQYFILFSGQLLHNLAPQKLTSSLGDAPAEAAHYFTLSEIVDATNNFEKKIGSGGFGIVFYGRLNDGKEIAVKILTNDSFQGKREFTNEVRNTVNLNPFRYSLKNVRLFQ